MQAKRLLTQFLFGTLIVATFGSRSARAEISAEEVRSSITRAVSYLKGSQSGKGTWTPRPNFTGGVTALCTLALLESGVPVEDPSIQKALRALRQFQTSAPKRTYVVALTTMVYLSLIHI